MRMSAAAINVLACPPVPELCKAELAGLTEATHVSTLNFDCSIADEDSISNISVVSTATLLPTLEEGMPNLEVTAHPEPKERGAGRAASKGALPPATDASKRRKAASSPPTRPPILCVPPKPQWTWLCDHCCLTFDEKDSGRKWVEPRPCGECGRPMERP